VQRGPTHWAIRLSNILEELVKSYTLPLFELKGLYDRYQDWINFRGSAIWMGVNKSGGCGGERETEREREGERER
jgi:hypothetical protein